MTTPAPMAPVPPDKGTAFVPHGLASCLPGAATGPLAGLSAVVKDAFDIAGERTGIGSPEWLARSSAATITATAVQKVLDAGATVVGKTICDEFLYSVTGANAHYGTPINPRAPDRLPGGSSSGSASATAAGACDFGLGTDTGGSVRVPAALCGIFGIRTSHGRVDRYGVVPMAPSFDSVGWVAPSAGVLHNVGSVLLHGQAVTAPIDRLVVAADLLVSADEEVQAAVRGFTHRAVVGISPPDEVVYAHGEIAEWVECFRAIQGHETWQTFGGWITAHTPKLGPGIDERMRYASSVTEAEYTKARMQRLAIQSQIETVSRPGTVVLLPTVPCPAPRLDASTAEMNRFRSRTMPFTCIAGLAGLPQVSMPIGLAGGAPVAVSLLGWAGGDEVLLDLAAKLAVHCAP